MSADKFIKSLELDSQPHTASAYRVVDAATEMANLLAEHRLDMKQSFTACVFLCMAILKHEFPGASRSQLNVIAAKLFSETVRQDELDGL